MYITMFLMRSSKRAILSAIAFMRSSRRASTCWRCSMCVPYVPTLSMRRLVMLHAVSSACMQRKQCRGRGGGGGGAGAGAGAGFGFGDCLYISAASSARVSAHSPLITVYAGSSSVAALSTTARSLDFDCGDRVQNKCLYPTGDITMQITFWGCLTRSR